MDVFGIWMLKIKRKIKKVKSSNIKRRFYLNLFSALKIKNEMNFQIKNSGTTN